MIRSLLQRSRSSLIEWGVCGCLPPGETESGDMHVVQSVSRGALVAAVDGAGHGSEAAAAARIAVSTLKDFAGEGIISLLRACHQRLKGTRGAVMSLVSFDGYRNEMMWLGVGNVAGMLRRRSSQGCVTDEPRRENSASEGIALRGGIVGYRLPLLKPAVLPVSRGDTVALATDGIHPDFVRDLDSETPPRELAARLCAKYSTGRDDGLVLVVRYLGWSK